MVLATCVIRKLYAQFKNHTMAIAEVCFAIVPRKLISLNILTKRRLLRVPKMITSVPTCIPPVEPSSTSRRAESPNAEPNGRKPSGITGVGPTSIIHENRNKQSSLKIK